MGRKLDKSEAIRSLSKKHDVKIGRTDIQILSNYSKHKKNDLGNKSWGLIDFLCNHCGYSAFWIKNFI